VTDSVGKVFGAYAEVLKSLQVDAGGTLPGNMGGKKYITAKDIADEVKKKFVEHGLIMIPNEVIESESIQTGSDGRRTSFITVRGEYRIIHVQDASELTITGVGGGLATGTAVAPNIASTFALKNALQRAFLISENAVEEAALKETNAVAATPPEKRAEVTAAASAAAQVTPLKKEIAKKLGIRAASEILAKGNEYFKTESADSWKDDAEKLAGWAKHLETGEVA